MVDLTTFSQPRRGNRGRAGGRPGRALRLALLIVILALGPAAPLLAEGPVVIKLWDHHIHDKRFRKDIFKVFNQQNPDIRVEYTSQVAGSLESILAAAFASGTPPDIFIPVGAVSMPKMVELGWIMPLDDVAPSKAALQKWMAQFPQDKQPFVENLNVFDGKVYSWPIGVEGGRMMLFWNPMLFRQAGLKGPDGSSLVPVAWDDVRSFAKKITEVGQGKVYGIVHGNKGYWGQDITWSIAVCSGWSLYSFDARGGFEIRTGRHDFASPVLKSALQLWIDMKNDGSIFPGDLSMDDEQAKFRFSQDLAGMIFGGPWVPGGLIALNPDLEFDVVLPPTQARGKRLGGLGIGPVAGTSEYVVSSKVKNKDAIWRIIDFMTSKDYQEGWVKAAGGFSVFPQYNKPEFFPHPTMAKIADMGRERRINPEMPKGVKKVEELFDPGKPDIDEAETGIYIGLLGWDVLDEMNRRFDAALDRALVEARLYGVNLTRADFTFPDWDPTKDYVPKAKK